MGIKDGLREYLLKIGIKITPNDTMLCPFHNDTNPSMKVYETRAKCFACGESADIYDFAAWHLGLPRDKAHFSRIAGEVEAALGIASEWKPSVEERRAYYRRNRDITGKQMPPLSKSAVYRDALLREMAEAVDMGNTERALINAELLLALFMLDDERELQRRIEEKREKEREENEREENEERKKAEAVKARQDEYLG
jgi:DNA primase